MRPIDIQRDLLTASTLVRRLISPFKRQARKILGAPDPLRMVRRQAAKMIGTRARHLAIAQTPLRVRESKQVTLLEITSRKNFRDQLAIVQLATNSRHEFRIYKHQASNDEWHSLAPRVYSTHQHNRSVHDKHAYIILTELVCGEFPSRTEESAQDLAERILAISLVSTSEIEGLTAQPFRLGSDQLMEKFISVAIEADQMTHELDGLARNWDCILSSYETGLRPVPCHNDLNYSNIGFRKSGSESQEIVFFDWAQFNTNFLGCDMHHLIRQSISKPKFRPFVERTFQQYKKLASETHGVIEDDIDRAALTYALLRCMWRSVRTNGSVMQAKEVGALYSRLARIYSMT